MRTFDRNLLADLNMFLTIIRRGSMAKAGIELGVTASALSHRMRKLEAALGVRLLNRSSRALQPTAAGAILAAQLDTGFRTISDALTALEGHRNFPLGRLRLNVLRDAARLVLAPVLHRYGDAFPQMHLDVTVDDRLVDIVGEGFDAGIRYGDRVPLDMVRLALTRPMKWVLSGRQILSRGWDARTRRRTCYGCPASKCVWATIAAFPGNWATATPRSGWMYADHYVRMKSNTRSMRRYGVWALPTAWNAGYQLRVVRRIGKRAAAMGVGGTSLHHLLSQPTTNTAGAASAHRYRPRE